MASVMRVEFGRTRRVFGRIRRKGHGNDKGTEEQSDYCDGKRRVAHVCERPALQMRGCGEETSSK